MEDLDKLELEKIYEQGYGFYWAGKGKCIKEAENKEEEYISFSPNNLYIEGDNLKALKMLQKEYSGKIKMIYIDPPYNTGKNFIYKDNYKKLNKNSLSIGDKNHSNWLNMMYPRIKLAKELLSEDGVIFISIDDNELFNLKQICDEIFTEENYISNFIWFNNERGRSIDKFIANTNENILAYAKNIDFLEINKLVEKGTNLLIEYNLKDEKSYYKKGDPLYNNNSAFNIETRPNLTYSIYINKKTKEKRCIDEKQKVINDKGFECWELPVENFLGKDWIKIIPPLRKTNNKIGCWRWGIDKFMLEADKELILEEKNGKYMFYSKNRLLEDNSKTYKYKNYIKGIAGASGTTEVTKLLENKVFNNPKPLNLIKLFCQIGMKKKSIILDFFSGSATTAHAVMQLNAEDGGERKYIMVQLPELCNEKTEAYKAGYKTICDIGKERIKRAGEQIKLNENFSLENREKLDISFKIIEI